MYIVYADDERRVVRNYKINSKVHTILNLFFNYLSESVVYRITCSFVEIILKSTE